jgi:hypothetical protein
MQVLALLRTIPKCGKSLDFTSHMAQFTFETMSQLTFSHSFNMRDPGEAKLAVSLLNRSQKLLGVYGHVPWVYAIAAYVPGLLRSNAEFSGLANCMVERRRDVKNQPKIPDIFSYLLKTEDNPDAAGFNLAWEARLAIVTGRYEFWPQICRMQNKVNES